MWAEEQQLIIGLDLEFHLFCYFIRQLEYTYIHLPILNWMHVDAIVRLMHYFLTDI